MPDSFDRFSQTSLAHPYLLYSHHYSIYPDCLILRSREEDSKEIPHLYAIYSKPKNILQGKPLQNSNLNECTCFFVFMLQRMSRQMTPLILFRIQGSAQSLCSLMASSMENSDSGKRSIKNTLSSGTLEANSASCFFSSKIVLFFLESQY